MTNSHWSFIFNEKNHIRTPSLILQVALFPDLFFTILQGQVSCKLSQHTVTRLDIFLADLSIWECVYRVYGGVTFRICLPKLLIESTYLLDREYGPNPLQDFQWPCCLHKHISSNTFFVLVILFWSRWGKVKNSRLSSIFSETLTPKYEFDQNHGIHHLFHLSLAHLSYREKKTSAINYKRGVVRQWSTENQARISLHFNSRSVM